MLKPLLSRHQTELTIVALDYILEIHTVKSVNVFAFTNKLRLVMKGNELELWIASLTTCHFITEQSNRQMLIVNIHCAIFASSIKPTPSFKQTLGKVLKVSA